MNEKKDSEKPKGIDLDGVGDINGEAVMDVDLDKLAEKPWRMKGVNQSEFFNYGFTEDTWKIYQVTSTCKWLFSAHFLL